MSIIRTITGVFTAVDVPVALSIPIDAKGVALRVRTNPPADVNPEIDLVVEDPQIVNGPALTRTFVLQVDGELLPATYVKYIATVPFGPDKTIVHMIEIAAPAPTA